MARRRELVEGAKAREEGTMGEFEVGQRVMLSSRRNDAFE